MNPPVSTITAAEKNLGLSSAPGPGKAPGDGGRGDGNPRGVTPPAGIYRIGMLTLLLAVSMTFAVLSSAYVYLVAQPHFWNPIAIPRLVWLSTALILLSSFCLTRAAHSLDRGQLRNGRRWLSVTLSLGGGFLVSQMAVWIALSRQGLVEAGNQQRSFFLILSITHGIHVLGGLAGLAYLRVRAHRDRPAGSFPLPAAARTVGLYWHFMAVVWIFLLTLLLVWK